MEKITADLAAQHAEMRTLLVSLTPEQWDAPSLCPGWSVADVVLHLAQTDEIALGSARGTMPVAAKAAAWDLGAMHAGVADVDEIAGAAVDLQRDPDHTSLLARWSAAAEALCATFARTDPKRPLPWVVGDLPARTLATTRLAEAWIHTGDIAHGAGATLAPTDRLWHIARLAHRTLPYAFGRAGQKLTGPVAVILDAPGGGIWEFVDGAPITTISGSAETFCLVAARRLPGEGSGLMATGPDAAAVLELVRTFA